MSRRHRCLGTDSQLVAIRLKEVGGRNGNSSTPQPRDHCARQMLERAEERFGLQPASVTADKSYGTGGFLSWLSPVML